MAALILRITPELSVQMLDTLHHFSNAGWSFLLRANGLLTVYLRAFFLFVKLPAFRQRNRDIFAGLLTDAWRSESGRVAFGYACLVQRNTQPDFQQERRSAWTACNTSPLDISIDSYTPSRKQRSTHPCVWVHILTVSHFRPDSSLYISHCWERGDDP